MLLLVLYLHVMCSDILSTVTMHESWQPTTCLLIPCFVMIRAEILLLN